MKRIALLLLLATPILAQQRNPLTRGLADALYVKLAGSDTVLGTVTFTNVTITGTCTGCGAGSGTVSTLSVVSANGFAGSVANPTTTPAITLSTTVTGVVKGNGTAFSAATAGTDYVAPGGALGTPSSGTLTFVSGLPTTGLTGTLQAAQEPAHTGDATNSAGSLALSVVKVNGNTPGVAAVTHQFVTMIDSSARGTLAQPADVDLSFTDITTNNATTSLHGYLPKLGGGTTNFLRADGSWAAPSSGAACSTCSINVLQKGNGANTLQDSGLTETAAGTFRTAAGVPFDLAPSVQTSDAATVNALLTGEMAYSNASTNTTGGTLVLAGGIGTRKFTVVTFGSTGGKTVTLTVNNVSTTLTEGTDWTCVGTSNNACASNLANAINANGTLGSKLTATATSANVGIDRKAGGNVYALTISTNAGAPLTATNGTDGATAIGTSLQLGLDPSLGGTYTVTVPSKNLVITPGGSTTYTTSLVASGTFAANGSSSSIGGTTAFTADDGGRAAERINMPVSGSGANGAPATDAIFSGPPSTGTAAASNLRLRTAPSGVSSSTLNTPVNRHAMKAQGVTLTSGAAANVLDVTLPTLTMSGGTIDATIIATDGTDMQSFHQIVEWSAVNKAASYTTNVSASSGSKSVSAGTLTTSWSVSNGTNKVTIQVTPTTSLTTTKFLLYYQVFSNGEQEITLD